MTLSTSICKKSRDKPEDLVENMGDNVVDQGLNRELGCEEFGGVKRENFICLMMHFV